MKSALWRLTLIFSLVSMMFSFTAMALQQERSQPQEAGASPQSEFGTPFDFGGVTEYVVTRDDFSLDRARSVFKDRAIAIIGYGVQGPAQALNLRDNGFNVVVGQRGRSGDKSYDKALEDGWITDKNLFSIEEATRRVTQPEKPMKPGQVQYLLSDAGQKAQWPNIEKYFTPDSDLYFSHGFGWTFRNKTGISVPKDVDVTLVAPKGAGRSVRQHFLAGRGINSSYAVGQNATSHALERALATGMGIGSGFLFETTFENEVHSDLTGERGVLMGAVYGLWQAGYENLRSSGMNPEEAVRHTAEVSTEVISKIIGEKGADGLFKELPDRLKQPFAQGFFAANVTSSQVFKELYDRVKDGSEAERVLDANSKPDYRETLDKELKEIADSELGQAATKVRGDRPLIGDRPLVIDNNFDAVMAGALVGLMHAQYDLFREKGHMPSEAFNETVEESTESLYPLIGERGIDWMYANCSTTAQRGALDWNKKFRDAMSDKIGDAYDSKGIGSPTGVEGLIRGSEMWRAGKTVRELRPENQKLTA